MVNWYEAASSNWRCSLLYVAKHVSTCLLRARSLIFWGRRGGYFWADFESHSERNACIVTDVSFEICQKDPDNGNHSDQPLHGLSRQDRNEFAWKYPLHSNISTCYRQTSNVDNLSAVISIGIHFAINRNCLEDVYGIIFPSIFD